MNKRRMIWVLAIFGGGGTAAVVVLLLAVTVVVVKMADQCGPPSVSGGTQVVQAKHTGKAQEDAKSIPRSYLKLYVEIGRKRNIPANVLAGIGKIETSHGQSRLPGVSSGENYAGAGGPMQFLASSWRAYGADGDGDGKKDRYEPADAILGATNHLRGSIGKNASSTPLSSSDIRKAVHLYNPGNYTPQNNPYANDVLAAANGYDNIYEVYKATFGKTPGSSAEYASVSACSASLTGTGSFGQRIAYAAAYFARKEKGTPQPPEQRKASTPYSWGGGTLDGVGRGIQHGSATVGFDCSGLARHAVYKASNKKIAMPRTTWAMWDSKKGVKVGRDELAPGDLVFFNDLAHMAIYYGEINGVRWMVEALQTGTPVKFSKFDERRRYVGALRIKPPSGMGGESPDTVQA